MALKACHECAREISDKAKTCPHCGWKVNFGPADATVRFFLMVAVGLVILGVGVWVFCTSSPCPV